MLMPVTQKDIAQQLGLSREAVKFALNGNGSLSAATRERILTEAQRLGYSRHSNGAARELAGRRHGKRVSTGLISMLVPRTVGSFQADPYFVPLLDGIEREATRQGYGLLFTRWEKNHLKPAVLNGGVDGIIVLGSRYAFNRVAGAEIPIVSIMGIEEMSPTVTVDDYRGGRLAAQHLIDLGHREIAYLGHDLDGWSQPARFAGYRDVLEENDIPLREELLDFSASSPNWTSGAEAMTQLLERTRDFTALICYNDTVAMGAVGALETVGLTVPGDVSVVGFDDVSMEYNFRPSLTSVRYDRESLGAMAVEMLLSIVGDHPSPSESGPLLSVAPVELMVRDSTRVA